MLRIAAILVLVLATFTNPPAAAPGWAVLAWLGLEWVRRRRADSARASLLKRLLAQAESMINDGRAEEAAGLLRSAIRYELAVRLSLPPSASYEQVLAAAPSEWGALLEGGAAEELADALKALIENPP